MRIIAAVLALLISTPALADTVEEVRQAEIAFAKAFADRDKARFFSFLTDDAVFLSGLGTLRGKPAVIERWSRFFDNVPVAPFSWGPERVEVTAGGKIGFSMGPIYDANAKHGGYYTSVWQKQADGAWKVVLDGPGAPRAPLPANAVKLEEGFATTPDGVKLYYRKLSGGSPITIIAPLDFMLHEPLSQFADLATVITYDGRSRGRSTVSEGRLLSIEQDVRDLETVRAHFNLDKFIPLGYSYLGKVVAMYAAAYPQHVARVIQLGPGANRFGEMPKMEEGTFGAPAEVVAKLEELRAANAPPSRQVCEAFLNVMAYRMVGDPKYASRFDRSSCELANEQHFFATFQHLWPSIQVASLTPEEMSKITMPVLVIHGTSDRNAHYSGGQAWAQSLPDARLVTVPGAAHAPWLEDPVTVFGAIRHFLRGEWPLGSER
ncbi:MAG TPA: alpha/beta fold hydrolase [Thermoanaerobaculia bacterium]|nr:alpha/beta fold hydrolase [Thermoanaerobaculia bacterium]